MPKAQPNSRMTPEQYAFSLEQSGIDLPPAQLEAQAHAAFTEIQSEMAPLAEQIAKQHGWASSGYRDVLRQLKKTQIAGDAILPFYQARLKAIEEIVVTKGRSSRCPIVPRLCVSPPRPKPRRCLFRTCFPRSRCTAPPRRRSLYCR